MCQTTTKKRGGGREKKKERMGRWGGRKRERERENQAELISSALRIYYRHFDKLECKGTSWEEH